MDEYTTLLITPLTPNEYIGCIVNLSFGRIYAHVEHDGNPFFVETAHGKAIITGTTFDIETNQTETKLIVAEGSVKFTSQAGSVDVLSGYFSEIFAKQAPIQPSLCDTKKLTAWATGFEFKTTLEKIKAFSDSYDVSDLGLTANSGPLDLEKINYEQWIEQKRDWFVREFPLAFQLKEALAEEDIETDYPQLLFTSGIFWQFTYPQVSNNQFSIITSDSLLNAVSMYDFDKQWLIKSIPSTKYLSNNLIDVKGIYPGDEAFQKWIEQFQNARKDNKSLNSDILLYSLHAGTYLTNTRILIWLYIVNEKTNLTPENKANILALLQNEVNEAEKIKENIIRLFTISENCQCEEFNVLIDRLIESLTEIMECEERLTNEMKAEK
ncbi:MAG: FecR domain-containing protein [Sedimentisphaerales bacterium]|nr:FecR domain-containing protein [Sedimentisphaerales bacterium]